MKLFHFLLCGFLVFKFTLAKLYFGKCPLVENIATKIECSNEFTAKVIGSVEMPATTLNFFHNQYKKPQCINMYFSCINSIVYVGELITQCRNPEKFKTCYGVRIYQPGNKRSGLYSLEYSFVPGQTCQADLIRDKMYILDFIDKTYMLIWSCWELDDDTNEQGVWILMNENLSQDDKYIGKSLSTLKLINPQIADDLILRDSESNDECNCDDCNYRMFCHLEKLNVNMRRNQIKFDHPNENLNSTEILTPSTGIKFGAGTFCQSAIGLVILKCLLF